jgi:hypothetical protein
MAFENPMTVPDVAERLDLTPARVYQLIKEKKLKADRLGGPKGPVVIEEREVLRFEAEYASSKSEAGLARTSR